MGDHTVDRCFAVVRVDVEGGVHPDGEPLLGGVDGFSGGVASGVADDFDACAEAVDGVAYEHDVLVPAHELAFAGRADDDDAFRAVLDLDVDEVVVGF